jgi:hypothetical protein
LSLASRVCRRTFGAPLAVAEIHELAAHAGLRLQLKRLDPDRWIKIEHCLAWPVP